MFPLIHLGRLIGGRYAVDCHSLVCACGAYQEDKKYLEANVSIFVSSQFPCRRSIPSGAGYSGGQIQGTVTDANGSVVSGGTVEAVQTDSGLHRTVTSGADGGYN